MALQVKDFYSSYTKKGDINTVFNVAREDITDDYNQYFAYVNDEGAYIISKSSTGASATLVLWEYYGGGVSKAAANFATDWTNRASLTYGEYYELFSQGA